MPYKTGEWHALTVSGVIVSDGWVEIPSRLLLGAEDVSEFASADDH
jgi:hypothetical protein